MENKRVWVSKWALTYGIFEIEVEPNDQWVAFRHPWTGKDTAAGPGDWHEDRWGALRQAENKRRHEMRLLLGRLAAMNNRKVQEYELRDLNNPKKPLREPPEDILTVKRAMARPGMEHQWGDSDLPPKRVNATDANEEGI